MVAEDYRPKLQEMGYFVSSDGEVQKQGNQVAKIVNNQIEFLYDDLNNPEKIIAAIQLRYSLSRNNIPFKEPGSSKLREIQKSLNSLIDSFESARNLVRDVADSLDS